MTQYENTALSRFAIWALMIGSLSGCAPGPRAGAAPTPAVADSGAVAHGLVFPGKVHRYALIETSEIEARPDDKLFRYSDGSATRITVFFYPADSAAAARDQQQVVAQEGALFLESLPLSVQRGRLDSYSTAVAHADSVIVDGRIVRGHVTEVATKRAGRSNVDLQYVYLLGTRFVKVRASVPSESWPNPDVPRFAHDLAATLARQARASSQGT